MGHPDGEPDLGLAAHSGPAHRLLELLAGGEAPRLFMHREAVPRRHVVSIIERLNHPMSCGSQRFALGLELVKLRRDALQAAIPGERRADQRQAETAAGSRFFC
ncbi:MAG: hypothetical protein ACLQME_19750 [Alphaproteobacteria bacterium]